ncbi:hypothetical protein [Algicella marina]|uniref:Uncharacterized protein n=1 Tax=Algicella marina TaxID=2683284 RepID=A0A6P1SW54_9RHOB|nr:hypothetical protein [Algicella marina]QHQ33721.1 hypothetical protein GO499_00270 [Algicella marina]
MLFIISIIAGGIGASAVAGMFPGRCLRGVAGVAVGLLAGTLCWVILDDFLTASIDQFMTLIMTFVLAASAGAVVNVVLGSLLRLLRDK